MGLIAKSDKSRIIAFAVDIPAIGETLGVPLLLPVSAFCSPATKCAVIDGRRCKRALPLDWRNGRPQSVFGFPRKRGAPKMLQAKSKP
jgi:hypothetical protein